MTPAPDRHRNTARAGSTLLADVMPIARAAGELLREHFGRPGEIRSKGTPGDDPDRVYDVVTELDFKAEQLILQRIRDLSPDAVVLAEEGGVCLRDPAEEPGPLHEADDLWIVDPLDGTINYSHSIPHFCVSVARYRCGEPAAGAIYDPMLDEMFTFDADDGARLDGEPISVSATSVPGQAIIGIGSTQRLFPEAVRRFQSWRRAGSAALALAWVACGRFDAYVQMGSLAPWDYGVGAPLVLAAGGSVTTQHFDRWEHPLEGWSGMIAANGDLHHAIRKLL